MTYSFFNYNAHNMPNLVQQEGKQTNLSNSSVMWYRRLKKWPMIWRKSHLVINVCESWKA